MVETGGALALLGALAMIASVVRGAIKWKDTEFPAITKVSAQIMTGIIGLVLFGLGVSMVVGGTESSAATGASQAIKDYRAAASAVCESADKELTALGTPDQTDPQSLAQFHQGWAIALANMQRELQKLQPPSAVASDHSIFLSKTHDLVQAFQSWANSARSEDRDAYEQVRRQVDALASNYNNLVLAMGINKCRLEA